MDSLEIDPNFVIGPFVIFSLILALITWFAMLGGSMKGSLHLLLDEPPEYFWCLLIAVLMLLVNGMVFVAMLLVAGPQPWYIVGIYQAVAQLLVVTLLARCNPFKAFLAVIAHSFFSGVGTIAVVLFMLLCCGSALKGFNERASLWSGRTEAVTEAEDARQSTTSKLRVPATKVSISVDGVSRNPFVD